MSFLDSVHSRAPNYVVRVLLELGSNNRGHDILQILDHPNVHSNWLAVAQSIPTIMHRVRALASEKIVTGHAGGFKRRLLASSTTSKEEVKVGKKNLGHATHSRIGRIRPRQYISTAVTEPFAVPLTLSDVYLKDEQLPFAYVFKETLDSQRLIDSFGEILRRYPILGSQKDFTAGKIPALQCSKGDCVTMSFGESKNTLEEWIETKKSGELQHDDWYEGGGAPILSPLFDDLASNRWADWDSMSMADQAVANESEGLATVRITYFAGKGTSVGINISHLLGDASSCFRIAQAWGREMRGLNHPVGASNDRASATLTGMVSLEMADALNLGAETQKDGNSGQTIESLFGAFEYLKTTLGMSKKTSDEDERSYSKRKADEPISEGHEYVRLHFSQELLHAMKSFGIDHCELLPRPVGEDHKLEAPFVSTNDMITAFGWMIKRHISTEKEWNISMVVNLRNRGHVDGQGGVNDFSSVRDGAGSEGIFGNALTSIVAELPRSIDQTISMEEVGDAALAIRHALQTRMGDVPALLALSQSGNAARAPSQGSCFSSTSWRQFPLWDINFGCVDATDMPGEPMFAFYGRPSYALPAGDTYSSVLVPSQCGGCTYKMLAPSRQVQPILKLHSDLSQLFLSWAKSQ